MTRLFYLLVILLSATNLLAQNVGIGTVDPLNRLHVSNNGSSVLLIENTQLLDSGIATGLYLKTGNGNFPYTGAIKTIGQNLSESRLGLYTFASPNSFGLKERLSILDNGNVGIGTTNPGATLEVAGLLKITGGIPGVGKVLTSDATGLASWQTASTSASNYSIVGMGCQSWMGRNLDVTTYRNGDPIPNVTDATAWSALTTGAYCYYNNDSATYATTYGKLYNWYAVNDPRGLAPAGWHVPTDYEWTILTNGLGGIAQGGDLKEIGLSHWASPNYNATNISGFTGLPGGDRVNGVYQLLSMFGTFWCSTEINSNAVWGRVMHYDRDLERGSFPKNTGSSVRCLRD